MAAQNNPNASVPAITTTSPAQSSPSSTAHPPPGESHESTSVANIGSASDPNAPLLVPTMGKTRDKLETISERIETQQSQISQITSVHQSPPLQRPPKSSKWKWLKTGSTGPETDSPPRGTVPNIKSSPPAPHSTNPFDSNITEDDAQSTDVEGRERRPAIPLSLFIPRGAHGGNVRPSEGDTHDHVRTVLF